MLSELPHVQDLSLLGINKNVTGRTLKYFKKLKKVDFTFGYKIRSKALCELVKNCNELGSIILVDCFQGEPDQLYVFLQSVAKVLLLRTNDVPLRINLNQCNLRISQIESDHVPTKIFFEIDKNATWNYTESFNTFYSSYDIQLFFEKIRQLINNQALYSDDDTTLVSQNNSVSQSSDDSN